MPSQWCLIKGQKEKEKRKTRGVKKKKRKRGLKQLLRWLCMNVNITSPEGKSDVRWFRNQDKFT